MPEIQKNFKVCWFLLIRQFKMENSFVKNQLMVQMLENYILTIPG